MNDLRYPIGRFVAPAVWDDAQVAEWHQELIALPGALREVVAGLDEAELDTPYRDDGWTVRQVVHHLADSHLNAYTRFRLALTEDNPTILPYDQDAWAKLADSRLLVITPSLDILDGLHSRWGMLIKAVGIEGLARTFVHPEHDHAFMLGQVVAMYAWHGNHHTAQIRALRVRQGW